MLEILSVTLLLSTGFLVRLSQRRGAGHAVSIVSVWCLFSALVGYWAFAFTSDYYGGFYDLRLGTDRLRAAGVTMVLLGMTICWAGILVTLGLKAGAPPSNESRGGDIDRIRVSQSVIRWAIVLSVLALALNWYGAGWSSIFLRYDYLTSNNLPALIAGSVLCPVAVVVLGFICVSPDAKRVHRAAAFAVLLAIVLVFFSQATRKFSMSPAFFALGAAFALSSKENGKKIAFLMIGTACSVVLIPIPLYLRGMPELGLVPFFQIIFSDDIYSFAPRLDPIYNIFFSLPLTAAVEDAARIPASTMLTSINPLPSVLLDWYDIYGDLRLSEFQPYSAAGELLNFSGVAATGYCFVVGVTFSLLDNSIRNHPRARFVSSMLLHGGAVLFAVFFLQYNLRSATRIIYYLVIMLWLIYFLSGLKISAIRFDRRRV